MNTTMTTTTARARPARFDLVATADNAHSADAEQPGDAAQLGARIRSLRTARAVSLRGLAADLGISPSALSQIERGRMRPSVTRLLQIMSTLNAPLSAAFGEPTGDAVSGGAVSGGAAVLDADSPDEHAATRGDAVVVTRAGDAAVLSLGDGVTYRSLTPVPLAEAEVYETVYPPGSTSSQDAEYLRHTGHEMGTVTAGRLSVDVDGVRHDLGPGDSIRFPSATPHRIRNDGEHTATAVWINVR
ncbi:transcriptional regulator with XRE-family HTH domain/quercetin dioxygenase-like cupin family protein [Prauserella isguenensis]|uniref:Transcriptional regulator with XRE-family HTH domain/quercetin dioxygenase-like cupin family protein n=1 Tax=Prauserella isguenensis TaxID=1470180 RepID=A0A839S4E1_9PSEU|nr:cupin domain-containing protein [Prauserella isguenensis]MBB3052153.1 transcriptional regulator with XRE-family HTH domain/quercetin dioxygenase-like cupin family protein [Prauserella isguenensis]